MIDIEDSMLDNLKSADIEGFIKIGIEYADAVIKAEEEFSASLNSLFSEYTSVKKIDTIEKENLVDSYYNLYNDLVG
jgi:starch synthase